MIVRTLTGADSLYELFAALTGIEWDVRQHLDVEVSTIKKAGRRSVSVTIGTIVTMPTLTLKMGEEECSLAWNDHQGEWTIFRGFNDDLRDFFSAEVLKPLNIMG